MVKWLMTNLDGGKVLRPGKNFGSGQLIFENWCGGPVDVFLTKT